MNQYYILIGIIYMIPFLIMIGIIYFIIYFFSR
ncbi:Uncharacterised protein [Anaerostipes hadrus]|uniref:Uncharacterized protein n=1 Tax=Anaerostipes hadrus TaxID=649756 RepID=A0A173TD84_ANAHA|nr:Uncharacterised protein [Anaerostipes hadrus]